MGVTTGRWAPPKGALHVDGTPIATFAERDPPKLPWADLAVNLVFECAGVFKEEAGLTSTCKPAPPT
jgi:glyceraldehyde 3-phosphate dehydrogenase (phosphorylating)